MVVDLIEKRIFKMVEEFNGYNPFTFKKINLTKKTSLNYDLKLIEEEAAELLVTIFTEFKLDTQDLNFSVYFPAYDWITPICLLPKKWQKKIWKRRHYKKKITIGMLIKSAKAGKWLYD